MKLTKNEIEAIAETIAKQKRAEFDSQLEAKLKRFKSEALHKAQAKKYADAWNLIPKEIKDNLRWESKITPEKVINAMASVQVEKLENRKEKPHKSDYINQITIASIDSKSIEEIEFKLKLKLI